MRLFLLILLVLSGPYWLLLRQGFGRSFYTALIIASLASLALAAALDALHDTAATPGRAAFNVASYAEFQSALTWLVWFWHVPVAATGAKYWRKDHRPASWCVGHFHFWQKAPILTDTVLFLMLSPSLYYAYHHDPRPGTAGLILASIIAYYFLALLAHSNGSVLPFKGSPAAPRRKTPTPSKPNQTRLTDMPKGTSEDLSHIFSRRPQALGDIASGKKSQTNKTT